MVNKERALTLDSRPEVRRNRKVRRNWFCSLFVCFIYERCRRRTEKPHNGVHTVYGRTAVFCIFRPVFSPAHLLQYKPITEGSWRLQVVLPWKKQRIYTDLWNEVRRCPSVSLNRPIRILLTPWCRVLLEKLTVLQLVKKFPEFHGTRRFITALTSVHHLYPGSAQSSPYTHIPPPGDPS